MLLRDLVEDFMFPPSALMAAIRGSTTALAEVDAGHDLAGVARRWEFEERHWQRMAVIVHGLCVCVWGGGVSSCSASK
jgi:hypothetical protein